MSTTIETMDKKTAKVAKQQIITSLIGKEEAFKILAIAKAMRISTLILGVPGTGKTNLVLDYAAGYFAGDQTKGMESTFILETDEGTKSSEIKGTLDVEKLVIDNKYALSTPIAHAKFVIINEVDKASSGLRNAMLGVMNERILFNGDQKIPCNWEVFVGTANEIPKEEIKSPFWDRFMIKYQMERTTAANMMKYYKAGDKKFSSTFQLPCPTAEDIEAVNIEMEKLEIFLSHTRNHLSDRTLSFVPKLAKVVSIIYEKGIDAALVKTAELLTGDTTLARELNKKLAPAEKRAVEDKIDLLPGIQDEDQLKRAIEEIENMVEKYKKAGKLTDKDEDELTTSVEKVMEKHPFVVFEGVERD